MNLPQFLKNKGQTSILLSNLLIVPVALIEKWQAYDLFLVYFGQVFIISIFSALKISQTNFTNNDPKLNPKIGKNFLMIFFFIAFNFMNLVYAIFIFSSVSSSGNWTSWIYCLSILYSLLIFSIDSYKDYSSKIEEYKKITIEYSVMNKSVDMAQILLRPLARILPMHLIIFLLIFISGNSAFIIIYFVVKIIGDLAGCYFDDRNMFIALVEKLKGAPIES